MTWLEEGLVMVRLGCKVVPAFGSLQSIHKVKILERQCAVMQILQSVYKFQPFPLFLEISIILLFLILPPIMGWLLEGGYLSFFKRHASWKNIMASFLLPTAAAAMAIFPETVMPSGLCKWRCFLTTLRQGPTIWKRLKSWPVHHPKHTHTQMRALWKVGNGQWWLFLCPTRPRFLAGIFLKGPFH